MATKIPSANDVKSTAAPATTAKKAIDPKKAEKKANIRAAKSFLRKHLRSELSTDPKEASEFFGHIMKAVSLVVGTGTGAAAAGGGMLDKLREIFTASSTVDEMELFKQTRMGRAEMRKRVRGLIRDVAPEDRMWIALNEAAEAWVLLGTGEKPPVDWTGYIPNEPKAA